METIAGSLVAANRRSRPRNVTINVVDGQMQIDGEVVDDTEAPEVGVLLAVFGRHALTGLSIRMGTTPRELLQLAALLAVKETDPSLPTIFEAARRLGFWHIELAGESADAKSQAVSLPAPLQDWCGRRNRTTLCGTNRGAQLGG